ncbi:DNA topoisomerase 2-binding protein 1 [Thrips palmi]|uniref:DNA topoisomerase 2-binding protein 1 n=1 Tax=Thrips palmi TaxID=161013 RepID=A0A6P9A0F3_THRPL|nr:DNA topoisomerase 2-binding protein 1 [Thrips palmi]
MASKLHILTQTEDDEEVGLYFVVPQNLDKDECDNDMKEAFSTAADNDYTPEWRTEDSCLFLSPSKRNVFVFQNFAGAAFEHLQQFKCVSLIGPRCLTHCIMLGEPMPLVRNPSFTIAMKGLSITVSGGGVEVKNKIRQKVEMMSGVFLKSLTDKTTHVVVSSVVSSKYEKALELGVPARTFEWVDAVWKRSLKEYIFATDEKFDEYRCPPFLDLKVASTGLNIREQDKLKRTLAKYGGQYDHSLNGQVNVLVVKQTKGDKFKHAKLWGVPCVELRWIYDSVEAGNALPTKAYEVDGNAVSSPKSSNATLNFSANLSTVQFDQKTHIDETVLNSTTSSVASYCPIPKSNTPVKMPPPAPKRTPVKCRTPVKLIVQPTAPGEFKHLLSELDLTQTKRAGPFLDGCGVYIMGWNTEEEEILRKVLKCSGATRFSDLNDRVSHVLVGNLEKPFLRVLKNLSHTPHVVNIKWLIESVAQKSPAVEEPFNCMPSENMNASEAPSPLSKKGMALLQRETFSPKKPLAVQQSSSRVTEMSPNKGKQQLLAKYTGTDSSDNSISKSMSTSARCMPPPPVPSVKSTKQQHNVSSADESDFVGSQDLIFSGLYFGS